MFQKIFARQKWILNCPYILLFRTDFMASGKLWAEPAHKKGKFCTTKGPVYDETDKLMFKNGNQGR